MGDKFLEDLIVGSAITKSITSRYDPRTNHCYGDVVTRNVDTSYFLRNLYDLQTAELLAFAKTEKGKKVGMIFNRVSNYRDDSGFADANEYIDKAMQEDR